MVKTATKFAVSFLALTAFSAQATEIDTNSAQLQAMNKLTGRVSVIDVPVNGEAQFGSFSIVVRACKTRPPEETPDNFAFVDVVERKEDGASSNIFKGWMISSSPALNAVEHPIYDVWLLQCRNVEVDPSKILSDEELAARDEFLPETTTSSQNTVLSSQENKPEELLPVVENVTKTTETEEMIPVDAKQASVAETTSILEETPVIEDASDTSEIKLQPVKEDLAVSQGQDTVYYDEGVYAPDSESSSSPQNLLPVNENIQTPDESVDEVVSINNVTVEEAQVPLETVPEATNVIVNEDKALPYPSEEISQDNLSERPQQLISFEDEESVSSLPSILQ